MNVCKVPLLLLLIATLCACVADQASLGNKGSADCQFAGVRFDSDFPAARLNGCQQLSDTEFVVTISPESTPGHHSPWFAFKVEADSEQAIAVTLAYSEKSHRYRPKTSIDGETWSELPESAVVVMDRGKRVTLNLIVSAQPLWVSAQEIIDNDDYKVWSDKLAQRPFVSKSLLGKSTQGRDVFKLNTAASEPGRLVVLVGRQHPPEVTGALAMLHFVERLLADDQLATAFREQFALLIVPNMNPDGVFHGHWRNNVNGVDLNRDWGPFSQPETQLLKQELLRLTEQQRLQPWLFLDFHSTFADTFYTEPLDAQTVAMNFTSRWLAAIESRISAEQAEFKVSRKPGKSSSSGVAKGYMYSVYGIPSITYEIGDNTDRTFIRLLAVQSAEEMMKTLLDYTKNSDSESAATSAQ